MKVCSYNVNSIRARKDLVKDWILKRNNDIDVFCLQELKVTEEFFPFEDFVQLGYACEVYGQKTYNGVAILSKHPAEDVHKGFGNTHWDEQRRIISALIHGVRIINIYAPHGGLRGSEKFQFKLDWYQILLEYLSANHSPKDPIIITGDLNVAHTDKDVFSPEQLKDIVGTMPEERESFQTLLDWGLSDAFRYLYPDKRQFTWWDYQTAAIWRDEGLRIDYFLCTKPLLTRLSEIEVDLWPRRRRKPTPSDHAPLIANLSV